MPIPVIPMPLNREPKEPRRANTAEKANARRAADALCGSFPWDQSAEGADFWRGVHCRLWQIGKDGIIRED